MSLENNIERIATALEQLVKIAGETEHVHVSATGKAVTMPEDLKPEKKAKPAKKVAEKPVEEVAVEVEPTVPMFGSPGEFKKYVMESYQSLGANGAKIQNVLTSLGIGNINDTKSEQYAAVYAGVEALKG